MFIFTTVNLYLTLIPSPTLNLVGIERVHGSTYYRDDSFEPLLTLSRRILSLTLVESPLAPF